jgi:hypothetical protein
VLACRLRVGSSPTRRSSAFLGISNGKLGIGSKAEDLRAAMQAIRMPPARPTIAHGASSADRIAADSPDSAPTPQIAKTLTYEVIARALADLSRSIPLMVVFEDMHWADTFTLGLLDYLSRNLGPYPILLVASYRTDELVDQDPLRQLVAELLRIHHVVRMELGGLEGEELGALMTGILGHRPRRALVDTTMARTAGNPFFVEEVLTAGVDEVPDDLLEVVVARVRRLARALSAPAGGGRRHRFADRTPPPDRRV